MRSLHLAVLFLLVVGLTGCAGVFVKEEVETEIVEFESVITPEEFLEEAVQAYADEIGVTEPGKRIVIKYDKPEAEDFSVYVFDDKGFTHNYYFFAYEEAKYFENQNERLKKLEYVDGAALTDDDYHMVKFASQYVNMGTNSYNYFRDMLTQRSAGSLVFETVFEGYMGSVVGELGEYVQEEPELVTDEEGYTLFDNSDDRWSYIVNGDGEVTIISYMPGKQQGSKLIIPDVINGKEVCEVRELEVVEGVTCVEVSEGIKVLKDTFKGWADLNRLILHDGLTDITADTLEGTNVQEVALPETLQTIGDGFFARFNVGDVIELPWNMDSLSGFYQGSDIASIIVPGKIKTIQSFAFEDCALLTAVVIEEDCVVIEEDAFTGAPNLQAVSVPESVTFISDSAFRKETLLIVKAGSYAEGYAERQGFTYTYH